MQSSSAGVISPCQRASLSSKCRMRALTHAATDCSGNSGCSVARCTTRPHASSSINPRQCCSPAEPGTSFVRCSASQGRSAEQTSSQSSTAAWKFLNIRALKLPSLPTSSGIGSSRSALTAKKFITANVLRQHPPLQPNLRRSTVKAAACKQDFPWPMHRGCCSPGPTRNSQTSGG